MNSANGYVKSTVRRSTVSQRQCGGRFSPISASATIPCLGYAGFGLAQPYLINSMITYITFHDRLPENYGYGLVGAYALCYIGLAVSCPESHPSPWPLADHLYSLPPDSGCKLLSAQ